MTELPVALVRAVSGREARAFEVDGREIVLCEVDGEICALSAICTHEDLSLEGGAVEDGVLTCPWHGAQYDVRTGRVLALPAVRPLATFRTRVEDGRVWVDPDHPGDG